MPGRNRSFYMNGEQWTRAYDVESTDMPNPRGPDGLNGGEQWAQYACLMPRLHSVRGTSQSSERLHIDKGGSVAGEVRSLTDVGSVAILFRVKGS